MLYTKIRLDFKYAEKGRFYRVLLIQGNPDLLKLGIAFGEALLCEFEHCFLITCSSGKKSYVMAPFLEDPFEGQCYIMNHFLNELPDEFDFEYDTGDGWDFHCKRYKKQVEYDSDKELLVIEGAGQGIWEDNIGSLYAYFEGKIGKDCNKEMPSKGIYKPWNLPIDKFSDFDLPLDLDSLNAKIDKLFLKDYKHISKGEKDYIKQNKVNVEDQLPKQKEEKKEDFFKPGVYEDVSMMILTEKRVKQAFVDLSGIYGENKAKNILTAVYFKHGIIAYITGKSFEMKRYLSDLDEMMTYLKKPAKK